MYEAAVWWLVVEILAFAALPAAAHLFRNLPDKGYGLAKAVGIILPAYTFWLLSSLGILDNVRAAIGLVVAIVGAIAWTGFGDGRREVARLWREQRGLMILIEVLFALAFALWCLVRSYNPEITATEKPMEIAFLNGVLRSERFPPVDPWLSGYSISYYYFGYVMVAMLAKLSGIPSSIAFNLAIALLFALTATGAFSLAYNLAAGRRREGADGDVGIYNGPVACGFLGALFVAVMGNLEGLLEMAYSRAALPQSFWLWLNIQNLDKPYVSPQWYPTEWFWWFKASRVIGDFDPITKVSRDYTINEFPYFSFLLGDLHPHVLALPFTFVAMGLALCILKSEEEITLLRLRQRLADVVLWGIVLGGLGFLNSWDLPTYLALLVLAFVVKRKLDGQSWLKESALFGLAMLGVSVALYALFYLGFSSQVKGLGIVLQRTKLHQFLIFWGPFLFFAAAFLVATVGRMWAARSLDRGVPSHLTSEDGSRGGVPLHYGDRPHPLLAARKSTVAAFIALVVVIAIVLVALDAAVLAVLFPIALVSYEFLFTGGRGISREEDRFVILLVFLGSALLFVCELVFVLDFFGNRMNTVFKVYYQVWQMLAVASAFVVYWFLWPSRFDSAKQPLRVGGLAVFGMASLLAVGSFVYPVTATIARTGEASGQPVLDGRAFMAASERSDHEAITWLNENVLGTPVILEAVGGSYSQFGRVSAFTGLPTVVGWDGHELQWRGSGDEAMRRKADVATIYQTADEQLAQSLLRRYDVAYVYVGNLEREAYGKAQTLDKFARLGDAVYQRDGVTIYKLRLD